MRMTNSQFPTANHRTPLTPTADARRLAPTAASGSGLNPRLSAFICGSVSGICCVCLLLLGCESSVEKYKPEPNVYCVLRTDRTGTTLLAGMTLGYYDSVPDTNQWQGTSGVSVSIGHRGKVTVLSAVADSAGYYGTDSLPVVPGDTYSLSATYLDGTKVSGTTVVPDTLSLGIRVDTILEVPWPGDTYATIKVSYTWPESRGASGYFEQMDIWYRSGEDSSLERYGPMFTSTRRDSWTFSPFTYVWDSLSGEVDSLQLDRVRIEVKAVDRNYYDYVFSLDYMGGVEPDKMHLDGGVGVFGSACIVDSTLWFQPRSLPRGAPVPVTHDSSRPSAAPADLTPPPASLGIQP